MARNNPHLISAKKSAVPHVTKKIQMKPWTSEELETKNSENKKPSFGYNLSTISVSSDSTPNPLIQPKLTLGSPEDEYEQEAGKLPKPKQTLANYNIPLVQKQEMPTEGGVDFSQVRVNNDSQAVQMNQGLGAQAFTHRNDIYFGAGKSPGNNDLTAHELNYVGQQNQLDKEKKEEVQTKPLATSITPLFQSQTIQRAAPALSLAGIGAALTSTTAAEATAMAGLILSVGTTAASVGTAIMPGQTGVQTINLENGWMSELDKGKLELIIQYKIVNAYIEMMARQERYRHLFNTPEQIRSAEERDVTLLPPVVVEGGEESEPTQPDTRSEAVTRLDSTILEAVKRAVKIEIEETLNTNQKTAPDQEYIWSDSGNHTADYFGTVGAVLFEQVRGTFIRENLSLNAYGKQVPDLIMPLEGQLMEVRQFRGGRMRKSPIMETGLNDDLGINLVGNGPDINSADNNGHGIHTYNTEWNWDDNTTHGNFGIQIGTDGTPEFLPPAWRGTPED